MQAQCRRAHPAILTRASNPPWRFKRLADVDVRGKRVFIRADLNVPQDDHGAITDDTRIRASRAGDSRRARARCRGDGDLAPRPPDRRRVERRRLARADRRSAWRELLGRDVPLIRDWVDGGAWHAALRAGELVLLENCRFNEGEKKDDDALARKDGDAVRRLRQRRLRHRAPRRSDDARHRAASRRSRARARCSRPSSTRWARRWRIRRGRWWRSSPARRCRPSCRC